MFHKKIIVVFSFFFSLRIAYIILTGAIIASESGILIIIALHVWAVVIGATCVRFLRFGHQMAEANKYFLSDFIMRIK